MTRPFLGLCLVALSSSVALAAPTVTLSGTSAYVPTADPAHPIALSQTSTGTPPTYGAATFTYPSNFTFGSMTNLGADFNVLAGQFGGGSPRFSLSTSSGNIFVYFGSFPNYTDVYPTNTWQNSGNLLGPGTFVDTTQVGGAFYDPIANAQSAFGALTILSISLVTDGGWFGPNNNLSSILFDNIRINNDTFSASDLAAVPEPASLAVWGLVAAAGTMFGLRRRRA